MTRRLLYLAALLSIALATASLGAPPASAQTWQTGKGLNCGTGSTPGTCISSGPGCSASIPPGQCVFPKASAVALCRAHPKCVAVVCYGTSCLARQNANFVNDPKATSVAVPKTSPPSLPGPKTLSPTPPVLTPPGTTPSPPKIVPSSPPPAPRAASKVLRDHLAAAAQELRSGLPVTLATNVDAVSAATRCASGCDKSGSPALLLVAKVTDFNADTMPVGGYKSRTSKLPAELCQAAKMRDQMYAWGIGLVVELVDMRNQKLEQLDITPAGCGLPPQKQPSASGSFSIRSKRGCLDVENKSRTDGALIVSAPCDDTPSQSFKFRSVGKNKAGDDIWMIANEQSGHCLALAGTLTQPGTALKQSACQSSAANQWFRWLDDDAPFNQISTSSELNLDVTFGASHRFVVTQQPAAKKFEQFFQAFPAKTVTARTPTTPTVPPVVTPPTPTPPAPTPAPTPPSLGRPIDEVKAEQERIAREKREAEEAAKRAEERRLETARAAGELSSSQRGSAVSAQLRDLRADLTADGFESSRSRSGALAGGSDHREDIGTLFAGYTYRIAGRCDQGCLDLDLTLFDPAGAEIASHTETDANPVIEVKPPRDGDYSIVVGMPDCRADPCRWGITAVRKSLMKEKIQSLTAGFEDDGLEIVRRRQMRADSLVEGDEARLSLGTLSTGFNYVLMAQCDADCGDLDLALLDGDDVEVAADTAGDAEPIIEIKPPKNGRYTVVVNMVSCDTENCNWGFVLGREPLQDAASKQAKLNEVQGEANDTENELRREGFTRVTSQDGELIEGAQTRVPLGQFQSGATYRVLGVCDAACGDFLIEVIDSRGAVEGKDNGSFPDIELVQTSTRTFSGRVTMERCSDDPCKFRVLVMKK